MAVGIEGYKAKGGVVKNNIFYNYGKKSGYSGPKIIFLGYLGLTITYMGWAPWHFSDVLYFYFVWYFLFLVSLVPILIGFLMLAKESEAK